MGRMRAGGIKFLVATDVAARGIDIEDLSHVFNYTFPEAPEIYIHRTGRTGRAGRKGTAISLIGPTEVGSFYYLKLLYKIKPEERSLPSEAEIRSHREGERVQVLRRALEGDPGARVARAGAAAGRARSTASGWWRRCSRTRTRASRGCRSSPKPRPAAGAGGANDVQPRAAAAEPRERERATRRRPRSRSGPRSGPAALRRPGDRATAAIAAARRATGIGRAPAHRDRDARPGPARERPRPRAARPRRRRGDDRAARRHERRPPPPLRNDQPPGGARVLGGVERGARPGQAAGGAGRERRRPRRAPSTRTAPSLVEAATARRAPRERGRDDAPRDRRGPPVPEPGAQGRRLREGDPRPAVAHAGSPPCMDIDVMNTHTYLNVAPGDAERIIAALTGKEMGGRQLICETAKPRRR